MEKISKFKSVKEFCESVKNGKTVYWSDSDYIVKFDNTDKFCDKILHLLYGYKIALKYAYL